MDLVLKNYEIKALGDFLYELSLKGKDSRMRSRFIALLEEQLTLIQREREILVGDFSKKDEEGNPAVEKDEEGREYTLLEDKYTFNLEISKLMSEDFTIEVKNDRLDMIKTIQDIVLNVDKEFSGVEAERYNRFCDIMESVNLEDTL